MQKNIIKSFCIGLAFLLLGSFITGFFIILKSVSVYEDRKYSEINAICQTLTHNIENIDSTYKDADIFSLDQTAEQINFYSDTYNMRIAFFDNDNNLMISNYDKNVKMEKCYSIIKSVKSKDRPYFEINYEGNRIYYSSCMKNANNSSDAFYLVVSTSADDIISSIRSSIINFLLILVIVTIIFGSWFLLYNKKKYQALMKLSECAEDYITGNIPQDIPADKYYELSPIIKSMTAMSKQIAINDKRREEFVSNISHELKTPITTISGFITGILDGTIEKKDHRKYLLFVQNEVTRINNLVSTMLNISKLQSNTNSINFVNLNVTGIIVQVFFIFEKQINDKHITVKGLDSEYVCVNGDRNILYQVFYNLVENAIKFTNQNGTIELSTNADNEYVYIRIKNTGKGIESTDIPKIFDRFYKTDYSRSNDKTGIGLGL